MENEPAIKVEHVSKDFLLPHEKSTSLKSTFTGMLKGKRGRTIERQHALKDISFEVKKGEFFGIVGRNGSGKSTLLKIIAQIYQPTKGSVSVSGRLVPFIELGVGFNAELTGRENVYLSAALMGFAKKEIDAMYNDIVNFAELEKFMDQKLKNYSSGMQVRLAFSIATRAHGDILLVDEVLAVGDAAFQRKCFEYFKELKANNKTVVFVTHDMSSVREYCDRALLIDKSEMQRIGDPKDVSRDYSLLFMDNQKNLKKSSKGDRWGNGFVEIQKVTSKVAGDKLQIGVTAKVNKPVDKLIYGVHIVSQDGTEITAMNNRMIQVPDVIRPEVGKKIEFAWEFLNIFNDGVYTVTLTLVDDVGNTLDWMTKATSFTVKRIQRSTTAVMPPLTVASKII